MEKFTVFCGDYLLHIVTSLALRNKGFRVWMFTLPYYSIVLPMCCRSFVPTTIAFACLWVCRGRRMWAYLFDSRHCSGNFFGTCDWKSTIAHNVCFVPFSSSHDTCDNQVGFLPSPNLGLPQFAWMAIAWKMCVWGMLTCFP